MGLTHSNILVDKMKKLVDSHILSLSLIDEGAMDHR